MMKNVQLIGTKKLNEREGKKKIKNELTKKVETTRSPRRWKGWMIGSISLKKNRGCFIT